MVCFPKIKNGFDFMKNTVFRSSIVGLSLFLTTACASAWNHGVIIGYGTGPDINHHTYTNSGGILSAEILSLKHSDWYNLTMDGSVGNWHTTEPLYQNLWTVALTFAFRPYIFYTSDVHPYLLFSSGPAYISSRSFGYNSQGANFDFQTSLGAGFELGLQKRADIAVRIVHYSNAYLFRPNKGFNIFPVLTVGYLF